MYQVYICNNDDWFRVRDYLAKREMSRTKCCYVRMDMKRSNDWRHGGEGTPTFPDDRVYVTGASVSAHRSKLETAQSRSRRKNNRQPQLIRRFPRTPKAFNRRTAASESRQTLGRVPSSGWGTKTYTIKPSPAALIMVSRGRASRNIGSPQDGYEHTSYEV